MIKAIVVSTVVMLFVSVGAVAQNPPKNADIQNIGNRDINRNQLNVISFEKEIEMGRKLADEVESRVRLIDDPVVKAYVNHIGQHIADNSDVKIPVTIKIVDSDQINALSMPGGFIYINKGMILAADNQAELAFVIAHAIANVAARHGAEAASKATLLNISAMPLAVFPAGDSGSAFAQGGVGVVPLTFLSFYRGSVSESDYLGLQYLYKAGYDPDAAITILEKVLAHETEISSRAATMSKIYSTHPPTSERIEFIRKNIQMILPARESVLVNSSGFGAAKSRLAKPN